MAVPQPGAVIRQAGRGAAVLIAGLATIVLAYLAAAWAGSSLPRNVGRTAPTTGIAIMVETNSLHTGIVMPVDTAEKDWRTVFPSAARPRSDGQLPTHIAVGWGEREVFLNTPTWRDFDPLTALRVLTTGGDALLRIDHHVRPAPSLHHRPMLLRPHEYARLVAAIEAALPGEGPLHEYRGYERDSVYLEAKGRYTLVHTCNTWIGNVLAEAGLPMGRWTPLAGGVMKWVPPPVLALPPPPSHDRR